MSCAKTSPIHRGRSRGLGPLFALVLLAHGCSGPSEAPAPESQPTVSSAQSASPRALAGRDALQELPEPDLSRAEGAVLEQLTGAKARVEELLADEATPPDEMGQAYGDLGLIYITYSFLNAAEIAFENAQHLQPRDHRWPYALGYLFQTQGRYGEAREVLSRSLELAPRDVPSMIRLGTVYLEEGENQKAREIFEKAYAIRQDSAAVLDGLGKAAAALDEPRQAVDYFESAIELQPSASSIRHTLGLAYRNLGEMEEARRNLEKSGDALVLFEDPVLSDVANLSRSAEFYLVIGAEAMSEERYDVAASQYRKALDYEPDNFLARKALGFSLQKLGDPDGAIEQLRLALEQGSTGDPEKDAAERAEVYRILGGLMSLEGRSDEAADAFRRATLLQPENLDAHFKLANVLARSGRLEDALEHYDRILEELPENTDTLVRRATTLVNLRRPREALADFQRAVETAPENAEVRLRYAEALDYLGRSADAERERAAVAELPLDDGQRAELAAAEGRRLQRAGDHRGAIARYREALDLAPGLLEARYQKAALHGHLGQIDDALAEFRSVLEEDPHHARARRGEVTALLLAGRYGEARARLTEALSYLPRDGQLAHTLARLLAAAPDARVRDGRLALDLAGKVHAARRDAETAQTLAMAHAETGDFAQALDLQRQLVGAPLGRERLEAYEAGQPWRAGSPEEILIAMGVAGGGSPRADLTGGR